jgi:hypothetical protein
MDPYGRILGFLDRSRYFFFQVASQLYWTSSIVRNSKYDRVQKPTDSECCYTPSSESFRFYKKFIFKQGKAVPVAASLIYSG